ncbi:phosphopantetheine-binding protein, partial [Nocardia neocaledoniensis]|uniref:phosphopantetheine-binding protein n=1 Tax=Nocardia neocaledoniensis TaxID=236511 RepID=UPI002454FB16
MGGGWGAGADAGVLREYRAQGDRLVAAAFAEVLGVARAGRDDDFFDLGGTSLLATRLMARLGADLDVIISCSITRTRGEDFCFEPSFALMLRNTLGATRAIHFDVSNA